MTLLEHGHLGHEHLAYEDAFVDVLSFQLIHEAEQSARRSASRSRAAMESALKSLQEFSYDLQVVVAEGRRSNDTAQNDTAQNGTALNDAVLDEAVLIDQISLLEDIKSAAAAAQARATHAFIRARAIREREEGVPLAQRGRGVGSEIALARRESPHAGSQATRMAYTLCEQMPHALSALTEGRLSECAASVAVREVTALSPAAQAAIDEQMNDRYGKAAPRRLAGEVKALANQADPAAQVKRRKIALGQRRVTVRPAPDAMAYLTALLPVEQAIACKKALIDAASIAPPNSDGEAPRTRSQAEADLLVKRLTGQATASAIPVELNLVMTDVAAFGVSRHGLADTGIDLATHGSLDSTAVCDPLPHELVSKVVDDFGRTAEAHHASAWIPGFGPIPAPIARDLLSPRHDAPRRPRSRPEQDPGGHDPGRRAPSGRDPGEGDSSEEDLREGIEDRHHARVFLRRILTDPVTGEISAMDTRKRAFTGTLRRALIIRDDQCRTPWCGAPIVHLDHMHPFASGGETSAENGTGLCARCNYTKEYDGWDHSRAPESGRVVRTPTGHEYHSTTPPLTPSLTRDMRQAEPRHLRR